MTKRSSAKAQPRERQDCIGAIAARGLKPMTGAQRRHLAALKSQQCVASVGPAGTGKTFVMAAYAAEQLVNGEIDEIVITRPVAEAGSDSLGFLKGDLNEKFAPWTWSFLPGFDHVLGRSHREFLMKGEHAKIRVAPLQYMQGMSFSKSLVLADEFENASAKDMKMILTRIGEGARIFLAGDVEQALVSDGGYVQSIHKLIDYGVPGVSLVEYGIDDVVRSDFCKWVLRALSNVSYREHPSVSFGAIAE